MNRGVFIPIGGSETSATLAQVIESVGGVRKVLVITAATSIKEDTRNKYDVIFNNLGCEVDFIDASDREGVDSDYSISKLDGTDMIFFTGGNQSRLCDCFIGSEFLSRVNGMLRNGLVVCGTSAGAVAMSKTMIAGGKEVPRMGKGLSLIPNVILDSHFDERNRLSRLKSAVDSFGLVGIGLSEDTGVILRKDSFEVVGTGNVTLVTSEETKVMSPGQTFRI
jgi:cyanophycinase